MNRFKNLFDNTDIKHVKGQVFTVKGLQRQK